MFPFDFRAEEALREVSHRHRRFLRCFEAIANVREIDVGSTPKKAVYREDNLTLYHYQSPRKSPYRVPILIVYALVNRPYMADMEEGRSMIGRLLQEGMDVYLIDWGFPSRAQRFLTLGDYINGYTDNCVDFLCKRHGLEKITLLGICQGGTLSLCYSSLHPEKVSRLVTMVTPVDFHVPEGLLNRWAQPLDVDTMVDACGNIPGDFMNWGFLLLKPFELMVQKYFNLPSTLDDEENLQSFLRLEKWIFDSPDQAGEAFRQFIKDFYQDNKLIKGEVEIEGKRVNLRNITMPVLNIYAEQDHLVPPSSTMHLQQHVGTDDVTTLSFPGGHIGIYVSTKFQSELAPSIARWLKTKD